MNSNERRIYIYVHSQSQKLVNIAKSGNYSPVTLALRFHEMVAVFRRYFGICPISECNLYNRMPEIVQEQIVRIWEEEGSAANE